MYMYWILNWRKFPHSSNLPHDVRIHFSATFFLSFFVKDFPSPVVPFTFMQKQQESTAINHKKGNMVFLSERPSTSLFSTDMKALEWDQMEYTPWLITRILEDRHEPRIAKKCITFFLFCLDNAKHLHFIFSVYLKFLYVTDFEKYQGSYINTSLSVIKH